MATWSSSSSRPLLEKDDSVYVEPEAEEQNSPYAEVRAAVPNYDDVTTHQHTLRMWVLGIIACTVCGVLNTILSFQNNAFAVGARIVTIGVWPAGKLWDHIVPDKVFCGIPLNPGPFTIKEHALITVMATAALGEGPTYATDLIAIQKYIMKEHVPAGYIVMLILSTQLIGLAYAGLIRRILVYPASLIFPNSLVGVTLLTNIHIKSNYLANGWRISRLRLLMYLMIGGAMYQWVPSFLAAFMGSFSWSGWIAPKNVVVNQLFGVNSGVSLLPICFDWSAISGFLGSPLVPPLGTLINMCFCIVLFIWIISPIISLKNIWWGDYLPLASGNVFDRYQQVYDVNRVITDSKFDQKKYSAYSPVFLSDTVAVSYGLSFAAVTSTLMHSALFEAPKIRRNWKTAYNNPNDLHMRLMKNYPEVNIFVYVGIFIVCVVLFFILVLLFTPMSAKMMVLALVISMVMFIPAAYLYATTTIPLGLNVIAELIQGFIQQGDSMCNMLFKTICYYPHLMGLAFLENMKLGHYLKLNPVVVLYVQIFGAVWGGFLQWLTLEWTNAHFSDFCSPTQPQGFTCSLVHVFHRSGVLWGTIGPRRVLEIYHWVLLFFAIGAALPLMSWIWLRKRPQSIFRYIHWPVFFNTTTMMPPASPYNYVTYLQAGFLFTYYVRRKYFNWWAKYNYTVSAGLELAVIVGQLIIIIVQLAAPNLQRPNWWGNKGAFNNADGLSIPRTVLQEGQSFGPSTW